MGRTILIPVLGKEYLRFCFFLSSSYTWWRWCFYSVTCNWDIPAGAAFDCCFVCVAESSQLYCQLLCAHAGVVFVRYFGGVAEFSQLCLQLLCDRVLSVIIIIDIVILSVCVTVWISSATLVTSGTILVIFVPDEFNFEE